MRAGLRVVRQYFRRAAWKVLSNKNVNSFPLSRGEHPLTGYALETVKRGISSTTHGWEGLVYEGSGIRQDVFAQPLFHSDWPSCADYYWERATHFLFIEPGKGTPGRVATPFGM